MAPLDKAQYNDANKVRGCASQVWLVATREAQGQITFRGDSDAHIVKGLIAILLGLFSGREPAEILAFDARAAFDRLGLTTALSAQRSNGLFAMVERIRAAVPPRRATRGCDSRRPVSLWRRSCQARRANIRQRLACRSQRAACR